MKDRFKIKCQLCVNHYMYLTDLTHVVKNSQILCCKTKCSLVCKCHCRRHEFHMEEYGMMQNYIDYHNFTTFLWVNKEMKRIFFYISQILFFNISRCKSLKIQKSEFSFIQENFTLINYQLKVIILCIVLFVFSFPAFCSSLPPFPKKIHTCTLVKSTRFKSVNIWLICEVFCKTALAAWAKWLRDVYRRRVWAKALTAPN